MKFNIATTEGVKEVEGEPIEIMGHKCFVSTEKKTHYGISKDYECIKADLDLFFVTELSTGMGVRTPEDFHFSSDEAINRAKELFSTHSEIEWRKKALGSLRYAGIEFPVN